jgi:hypothetical protein
MSKLPKGYWKSIDQRTYNKMTKRGKRAKVIYKTPHRNIKMEQHKYYVYIFRSMFGY